MLVRKLMIAFFGLVLCVGLAHAAETYGPITRDDNLWNIATEVRPDSSVSVYQVMLALQRVNPDAFANNNVNNLRLGVELRVPSKAEIERMSASQARTEFQKQYEAWQSGESYEPPDLGAPPAVRVAGSSAQADRPSEPTVTDQTSTESSQQDATQAGSAQVSDLRTELRQKERQIARLQRELDAAGSGDDDARLATLREELAAKEELLSLREREIESLREELRDGSSAALPESTPASDGALSDRLARLEGQLRESQERLEAREAELGRLRERMDEGGSGDSLLSAGPLGYGVLGGAGLLIMALLIAVITLSLRLGNRGDDDFSPETLERVAAKRPTATGAVAEPEADWIGGPPMAEPAAKTDDTDSAASALAEADTLLQYQLHSAAVELLESEIERDPGNHDLRLKLLEVHLAAGNRDAFIAQAREIKHRLPEGDTLIWPQAAMLGRTIAPDEPMFAGGSDHPSSTSSASAQGPSSEPGEPMQRSASTFGSDFADLEKGSDDQPPADDDLEAALRRELGLDDDDDKTKG